MTRASIEKTNAVLGIKQVSMVCNLGENLIQVLSGKWTILNRNGKNRKARRFSTVTI